MRDLEKTLTQLRLSDDELRQLYEARSGVWDLLTSTTTRLSPTGSRGSGDVHRMDILGTLTNRVDEQIRQLAELRLKAIDWIYKLDDSRQRAVLLAYFVNCRRQDGGLMTWDDVAVAVHISRRQVTRIYAAALENLQKMSLNGRITP